MPYTPERERWQLGGWRRGTEGRVRRQQSRDSCDSVAFARPRARRALTGLQGLNVRPCPTPPGPSAGSTGRQRAGQPRGMSGSFLRSQYSAHGCVLPEIGHYIFKSKEKCSTSGVPVS
eukprot:scaffold43467_cov65-Phaeocystis_antarctica.AAC.4